MADESTTEHSTGQVEAPANAGKTFTEADVERIIKDRLARQKQALDAAAAKAKQEADETALAEQSEYKTLAEQRQARIAELEPLTTEVETYRALIQAQVDEGVKQLPAHIKDLVQTMAPTDALAWLTKYKDELAAKPGAPNVNPTARTGAGTATNPTADYLNKTYSFPKRK